MINTTPLLMFCKLKEEIQVWRKSAFCPYLHWQVTLEHPCLPFLSPLQVLGQFQLINISLLWDYIFLLFMPHNFFWMLDIVYFALLGIGYFVFL